MFFFVLAKFFTKLLSKYISLNFPNGDSTDIIGRVESTGKPINGYKNENK